jgi:hypothetical protein
MMMYAGAVAEADNWIVPVPLTRRSLALYVADPDEGATSTDAEMCNDTDVDAITH